MLTILHVVNLQPLVRVLVVTLEGSCEERVYISKFLQVYRDIALGVVQLGCLVFGDIANLEGFRELLVWPSQFSAEDRCR